MLHINSSYRKLSTYNNSTMYLQKWPPEHWSPASWNTNLNCTLGLPIHDNNFLNSVTWKWYWRKLNGTTQCHTQLWNKEQERNMYKHISFWQMPSHCVMVIEWVYYRLKNTTIYQHRDKNTQYQFTSRQHVSSASQPSSGRYRTYKKVQQSEHSIGVHTLLYVFIRSLLARWWPTCGRIMLPWCELILHIFITVLIYRV